MDPLHRRGAKKLCNYRVLLAFGIAGKQGMAGKTIDRHKLKAYAVGWGGPDRHGERSGIHERRGTNSPSGACQMSQNC